MHQISAPLSLLERTTEASVGSKLTRSPLAASFRRHCSLRLRLHHPRHHVPASRTSQESLLTQSPSPLPHLVERVTYPRISITEHKRHNVEDLPHLDVERVRGLIPQPHRHLHPGGISMGFFISKRAHDWLEEIILQCALIHHSCIKDHRAGGAIEGFLDGLAKQGSRTAFLLASERKMRMIRSHL